MIYLRSSLGKRLHINLYNGQLIPLVFGGKETGPHLKLIAAIEFTKRIVREKIQKGPYLSNPEEVTEYLKINFLGMKHEAFVAIFLDNRHRIIAIDEMFRGTIDGATVHPREIVREALKYNAAACIFAHNHPSGVAEPSRADEAITKNLKAALALISVRVLDHFVVADQSVVSFSERGLI